MPYVILFDSQYLYVVGVYGIFPNIRIEKLSTTLDSLQHSDDLLAKDQVFEVPTSICTSFDVNKFIISGVNFGVYEISNDFSPIVQKNIVEDSNKNQKRYFGAAKINDFVYLNNRQELLKIDSTFTCVGKSDIVSKTLLGLKNGAINTLLFYNFDKQKIMRYDDNLNFVEDVVVDSGDFINNDAYEIVDFVETFN
jgi:hypothetical protein